jgi:hypothetical protein
VYEDEILIVSDSLEWMESVKRAIGTQLCRIGFGEAKFILGVDIVGNKEAGTINLYHKHDTKNTMENCGMLDITLSKVPKLPTLY